MENAIIHADVVEGITRLRSRSVSLVVTSPPYAQQRRGLYAGVEERDYPAWTVSWMNALIPKLTANASVFINIREHVRNGCISDYVHRTRLALRDAGWFEIDELIWLAIDKPPLGSRIRPRRTWERVLWFARTRRPFVDLFAVNTVDKIPVKSSKFRTSSRRGTDLTAYKSDRTTDRSSYNAARRGGCHSGGMRAKSDVLGAGQGLRRHNPVARITDVIAATCGAVDPHVQHPAMFPRALPRSLILTFSRANDLVVDPFSGSGTVPLVAQQLGRWYVGIDSNAAYVKIARSRLKAERARSH